MDSVGDRQATRSQLTEAALRLAAEFGDHLPAGTVFACLARCTEELRRAGLRSGLASASEAMARTRLVQRLPAHPGVPEHPASSG